MSSECNNNRLSTASIIHVIYIGNEQNTIWNSSSDCENPLFILAITKNNKVGIGLPKYYFYTILLNILKSFWERGCLKIFEISANQIVLLALEAMLNLWVTLET